MRVSKTSPIVLRALLAAGSLLALGCSQITTGTSPLAPIRVAPETVALEVTTVRLPLEDAQTSTAIWNEIDEQHFPAELRRHLSANGFRVGVTGSRLPPELERLIQVEEKSPPADEATQVVDFVEEPSNVKRRLVQVGVGRRSHVICTGEAERHPTLAVLVRGADGKVHGRTYRKVMGQFALKAYPQPDGHVKLEVSPEIEHGDPQRRFDPSEGVLRVEFGPPRETFDLLRTTAELTPGQFLVLGTQPGRSGTLGYQFLTEQSLDRSEQKLVLIRVMQRPAEALFDNLAGGR